MGILKTVSGADYSSNYVGIIDRETKVFRRKIGDKLERNHIFLQLGMLAAFDPVDLSETDTFKIRIDLRYVNNNAPIFSVCDYVNRRLVIVTIYGGTLNVNLRKETNFETKLSEGRASYTGNMSLGIDSLNSFDININFATMTVSATRNGEALSFTRGNNSPGTGVFDKVAKKTIAMGAEAQAEPPSLAGVYAKLLLVQLSNSGGILLHYDFLGDNQTEIFSDKARGIEMQKTGTVSVVSDPIDLE